jgi:osmotically-inducible protein OsmY
MRATLILVLVVGLIILGAMWQSGALAPVPATGPANGPVGTSGTIDVEKARERGAEAAGKAAEIASGIQETMAEAAISSKIKAKMALDDSVRALRINVTTQGSTVTLSGQAKSKTEHDRAVQLARETDGVSHLVDRIDVQPSRE